MRYLITILILLIQGIVFIPAGTAQQNTQTDTSRFITVAAGPQFKASAYKQFWWGKHWRKEWLQPVTFPLFDIDTTAGGLTPTKLGGGHQTKSLRLLNKNGQEYILRTIDKDLELLIPEEFKGSFINDIVNDQISTAHPFGPLAIASLTESIGSLHTNPRIVYVTDNPGFGEFRKIFANKLCLFEERPSGDGWEKTAFTNYADDVVNSEKLFAKLQKDNDRKVDQMQFLKIRLLDMVVNDWDRHPDQWVWTGYKSDGKTTYVPFARDRDQAFSKTDGVNIFILSLPWMLRSVRNFNPKIHDVIGVNLAAVSLDQQFTNELTKEQWQEQIKNVQHSLSDSAIHAAVMKMPKEINDISGAYVEKRLKQRRDDMMHYGMKYYCVINKKITILGSDKDELFIINKINRNTTEITIRKINKSMEPTDTLFHRIFTRDLTKEINLYGFGDNDHFIYTGVKKNRIYIRAFGGDGADVFTDSTISAGSGKRSRIYDTKDNPVILSNSYKLKKTNDTTYTTFVRRGFKYDWWKPVLTPGYNPDDGVSIAAGVMYRKKEWHKDPYAWEQSLAVGIATATSSVGVSYNGLFKQVIGKWDVELAASYKAPKYVLNFYGFGNETSLNDKDRDFFRVRSAGFLVNPSVSRRKRSLYFKTGLIYQSVRIQHTDNKFISQPNNVPDSSVFFNKYFGGADIAFTTGMMNNRLNPESGIVLHAAARYLTNLEEIERDHVNLHGYLKFYFPIAKGLVFAHRTGGATNIGDYEFYQANAIGGMDFLRGYWRTRFTGESSFYQNTELRVQVAKLKGYVLRGALGIYGFFDDGRVWVDKENSKKFHTGYGGGIYFIPYNKIPLNISYAVSSEVNVFTFKAGFFF